MFMYFLIVEAYQFQISNLKDNQFTYFSRKNIFLLIHIIYSVYTIYVGHISYINREQRQLHLHQSKLTEIFALFRLKPSSMTSPSRPARCRFFFLLYANINNSRIGNREECRTSSSIRCISDSATFLISYFLVVCHNYSRKLHNAPLGQLYWRHASKYIPFFSL